MKELEKLILLFYHQTLNSPKLTPINKTLKVTKLGIANRIILNRINMGFFVDNT